MPAELGVTYMPFNPYSHPLNWYPVDIRGSVELLAIYTNDVEAQAEKSIVDFKANAERIFEDDSGHFVTLHKGLDSDTWSLEMVFEDYFPSLQRRSAVITLYSFFENELDKLCRRVKSHQKLKLDLSDLNDKGIFRGSSTVSVGHLLGTRASRTPGGSTYRGTDRPLRRFSTVSERIPPRGTLPSLFPICVDLGNRWTGSSSDSSAGV